MRNGGHCWRGTTSNNNSPRRWMNEASAVSRNVFVFVVVVEKNGERIRRWRLSAVLFSTPSKDQPPSIHPHHTLRIKRGTFLTLFPCSLDKMEQQQKKKWLGYYFDISSARGKLLSLWIKWHWRMGNESFSQSLASCFSGKTFVCLRKWGLSPGQLRIKGGKRRVTEEWFICLSGLIVHFVLRRTAGR